MTLEQLFIYGLGAACAILGWLARELYAAIQALRHDLSSLELQISRDYVRYDRMQDIVVPIMDMLKEIKDTLGKKADK
jgi:hypothetical protein